MGNSHGKPEGEFSGDALFMFKQDSDSVKYLRKWKTKYGFSGELNVFEIETICKTLKTIAIENKIPRLSKSKHHELKQAEQWFRAAKERAHAHEKEKLRAVEITRGKNSSQALYTKTELDETNVKAVHQHPVATASSSGEEPQSEPDDEEDVSPPAYDRVTTPLYPKLIELQDPKPPPISTRLRNRPTNIPKKANAFPMLQVSNPHDAETPAYVFRPWMEAECTNACEGVTPPQKNFDQFVVDLFMLAESYKLNGKEMEKVMQKMFVLRWVKCRGDYTGIVDEGAPFVHPLNGPMVGRYRDQVEAVMTRARPLFQQSASHSRLAACKQGPGESVSEFQFRSEEEHRASSGIPYEEGGGTPYQQSLKHGILRVPLLGRDAMLSLKIYVTPVRGGMVAKALSDEDSEGVYNVQMSETIYFSYEDAAKEGFQRSRGRRDAAGTNPLLSQEKEWTHMQHSPWDGKNEEEKYPRMKNKWSPCTPAE
ncbi:uncharacterized protein LOC130189847 [Pseudoliparis swirei]|uniref:uncharacterized protein LOC130189847 n=1 Tax=Pseudoliparis swirei TaxID=2059687 RepID=UPI0024BE8717|nr:uncharacterized protein LOC130189847 [Pseudoliparis swirei]